MSPEDLVKDAPAQWGAVNQLLHNPSLFCDSNSGPFTWRTLRDSLWGTGLGSLQEEENVERSKEPVRAYVLPPTRFVVTPHRIVRAALNLSCRKILVRDEYRETEEATLLANEDGEGVFVVTGQSGIGLCHSPPTTH